MHFSYFLVAVFQYFVLIKAFQSHKLVEGQSTRAGQQRPRRFSFHRNGITDLAPNTADKKITSLNESVQVWCQSCILLHNNSLNRDTYYCDPSSGYLQGQIPSICNQDEYFAANLLRAVVDRMNNEYSNGYPETGRSDLAIRTRLAPTIIKEEDDEPNYADIVDEDNIITNIRDNEFLQHSSLWGQQYMTGGAGEGKQNLKPEGTIPNKNEVKTDAVLPAYCNPPNPCPVGFSADDGCIQQFENTAAFSREYQAAQKCMCDSEHMFDCPSSHEFSYDNDLEFEPMVRRFKVDREKERNVKKMFPEKVANPFLLGEMLPIAAKKGINVGY